jgi:hypothetical protein
MPKKEKAIWEEQTRANKGKQETQHLMLYLTIQ